MANGDALPPIGQGALESIQEKIRRQVGPDTTIHTIWLEDEVNRRVATWVKVSNGQYFGGLSVPNRDGQVPILPFPAWLGVTGMLDMIASVSGYAKTPLNWWLRSDGFHQVKIAPTMVASQIADALQCDADLVVAHYRNLVIIEKENEE